MLDENRIQNAINAAFKKKDDPYQDVKNFLNQVWEAQRRLWQIEDRIALRQASLGVRRAITNEMDFHR